MTDETRKERLAQSLGIPVEDRPAYHAKKLHYKGLLGEEYLKYHFIILVLAIALVCYFVFGIVRISGHSMDSTLHDNQIVFISKQSTVRRFDVVVLKERMQDDEPSKKIIKRVIGLPGDKVTVLNGKLYINDKRYIESYVDKDKAKLFRKESFTINVPKGRYFVLGDNRDVSKDSRAVGSFTKQSVVGVALLPQR